MIRLYLILLALLLLRFIWFYSSLPVRIVGSEVTIAGKLAKEPVVESGSYILEIDDIRAYVPIKDVYHYGDKLTIRGQYDRKYIRNPQVIQHQKTGERVQELDIREELRSVYFSIFKPREADVISGIVLGSETLDRQLKNDLANAGLIHLVVASGMNLTLLGGVVSAIFTGLAFHRRWGVFLASSAVIFYSFLTGFNPPIIRALIMFEAVAIGSTVGRKGSGLFGLVTAGYLMLWVDPALISSYSFLLSFASMIGQIFVSTLKFNLPGVLSSLSLVVLQNIFALVFTIPIILIGFSKFSLVSTVSNLLVVFLVEPLVVIGAFAGIVGLVSFEMARILLLPLSFILEYFLWVVEVFGTSEKFVMKVEGFNLFMAMGYYLILAAFIYYGMNNRISASLKKVYNHYGND